jgi:TRAP-type C4-dicarboxylate transport system permease small subunit
MTPALGWHNNLTSSTRAARFPWAAPLFKRVVMQRMAGTLSYFSAIIGGIVLLALTLLTCVSIMGRALSGLLPDAGFGPIFGDYEIVEAAIAFSIFCFLPLCQFTAGHATVDIFTNALSRPINRALLALWETAMALASALILWRLYVGMLGKFNNGETSFLLQFPTWWAYAACVLPAAILVFVTIWSASDRFIALLTGKDQRGPRAGATH